MATAYNTAHAPTAGVSAPTGTVIPRFLSLEIDWASRMPCDNARVATCCGCFAGTWLAVHGAMRRPNALADAAARASIVFARLKLAVG